jgi:hypothetical protein
MLDAALNVQEDVEIHVLSNAVMIVQVHAKESAHILVQRHVHPVLKNVLVDALVVPEDAQINVLKDVLLNVGKVAYQNVDKLVEISVLVNADLLVKELVSLIADQVVPVIVNPHVLMDAKIHALMHVITIALDAPDAVMDVAVIASVVVVANVIQLVKTTVRHLLRQLSYKHRKINLMLYTKRILVVMR